MSMPTADAVADLIVAGLKSLPAFDSNNRDAYTKAAMLALVTPIRAMVLAATISGVANGVTTGADTAAVTGAISG